MSRKSKRDILIESEIAKSKNELTDLESKEVQIVADMRATRTLIERLENCLPKDNNDD